MKLRVRHFLFYFLPAACNVALMAYLIWSSAFAYPYRHQRGFDTFVVFYAVGGTVVAISAITAFVHASSRDQGDRRMLVLALMNAIIPTLLLLILLQVI